jgi:hypothetical protein
MKKFDTLLESFLKEEENEDQDFSYYTGQEEEVMFLDNLDTDTLKRRVEEGNSFKTVHVATRKDAVNYGYPDQSGHNFYIFYTKQDFTNPALIPV